MDRIRELVGPARGADVELATYDGGHVFTAPMRERAYAFLEKALDA